MEFVQEAERRTPVTGSYDVVVCGGGPTGFVAAVAAARRGAKTLLIERYGFLGGTATNSLMVEFGGMYDGKRVLLGGVTHEFMHRLSDHGGIMPCEDRHSMTFDPESMIAVCMEMALEAKVELLLHTFVAGAVVEDGRVRGAIVETKSGREAILGKTFIDATGDGDLAFRAGGKFVYGREGDGKVQPVSLEVVVGNVDIERARLGAKQKYLPEIERAVAQGKWPIPTERFFSLKEIPKRGYPKGTGRGFYFLNVTNALDVDGTDSRSLTRGEIETRLQVQPLMDFMREFAPGFEECYLDRTGAQIGVRETRRFVCDYTMTRDDVLSARRFEDGVVPGCNSIDVHDVSGKDFKHDNLAHGTHYQIPYRCFLPKGLEGLLVSGRCISADHSALGSVRVMVVTMPMGEACGVAASLAAERAVGPREVDAREIRGILADGGTVLD